PSSVLTTTRAPASYSLSLHDALPIYTQLPRQSSDQESPFCPVLALKRNAGYKARRAAFTSAAAAASCASCCCRSGRRNNNSELKPTWVLGVTKCSNWPCTCSSSALIPSKVASSNSA